MKEKQETNDAFARSRSNAGLGGETFWMRCLFLCMAEANRKGQPTVKFSDVDKMVIEKSKSILIPPNE